MTRTYQKSGVFVKRFYEGEQLIYRLSKKTPMGTALYFVVGDGKLEKGSKQILVCRRCTINKKGGI